MKKRTFYIVNLDKNRIMLLSVLLVGFILLAFATGYRFGHVPSSGFGDVGNRGGGSGSLNGDRNRAGKNGTAGNRSASRKGDSGSTGSDSREYGSSIYDLSRKKSAGAGGNEKRNPDKMVGNSLKREKERRRDINGSISMENNKGRGTLDRNRKERTRERRVRNRRSPRRDARSTRLARKKRRTAELAHRKRLDKRRRARRSRSTRKSETVRRRDKQDRRTALLRTRKSRARSFQNPGRKSPSVKPKASGRTYTLQVGAYRVKNGAMRLADSLKKKGFGARVRRSRGRYFVMVGSAPQKDSLRGLKRKLRRERFPSITVPFK